MSFLNFIKKHIDDINNYVQPTIRWREGRFANPVGKAEATNGDFAEVVRNLPAELSRDDVVRFFREDLYKGFVATIMWGGISRFQAEEISRRNDRNTAMPKLERLVALLRDAATGKDYAIFTLHVGTNAWEFYQEILSRGDRLEVLEPASLRKDIAQKNEEMRERYAEIH